MPLTPGTTLGPYSVTAKIGEGGMGEVYRARDTKLDRDVALKVLPQAFTDDPDRLARFEREAKVLASLNHPNIGHIYGLEEAEGQRALVLELIEGPTLADRIRQGPILVDEALPIAKQIAEALEAAHEQGVIHRDLKPANIKVKDDGTVKVLDFGLAKAFGGDISASGLANSPTVTAMATQSGIILGTAAYMSPEQARGKPLDKRTDVWAFGCVLYEILSGHRVFGKDTVIDTLSAVLESEPDWHLLPAVTPAGVRRLLRRCLQKDRRRRCHDIADARIELEDLEGESADEGLAATTTVVSSFASLAVLVTFGCGGGAGQRQAEETEGAALLLSVSVFGTNEDGSPKPLPARMAILTPEGKGWSHRFIEDPDSNVFHKAMVYQGARTAGILTLGGTKAAVKLWTPSGSSDTLWEADFGGEFSRMRDAEVGDIYGDGAAAIAVATHDQGVVAGPAARRLGRLLRQRA